MSLLKIEKNLKTSKALKLLWLQKAIQRYRETSNNPEKKKEGR
jgi:hypothetical protein